MSPIRSTTRRDAIGKGRGQCPDFRVETLESRLLFSADAAVLGSVVAMTTAPLWRGVDPIPVLLARRLEDDEETGESNLDAVSEKDAVFFNLPPSRAAGE